ncbi:MAG: hypothetical protein KJ607_01825 [Bacteroidetes bacterium]|nr:hypothetical protein [Bacteroidota bacterium]
MPYTESDNKPVFAFDRAFIRIGKTNQKMSNQFVRDLIKRYSLPDFDKQTIDSDVFDIEWDKMPEFIPFTV